MGIATSLALTMYKGNDLNNAMGVPFFYGLVEAVFVGIYCFGAWKCGWTKAPAGESFCTMLWTSYEVMELEKNMKLVNGIEVVEGTGEDEQNGDIITTYLFWDNKPKKEETVDEEAPSSKEENKVAGSGIVSTTPSSS